MKKISLIISILLSIFTGYAQNPSIKQAEGLTFEAIGGDLLALPGVFFNIAEVGGKLSDRHGRLLLGTENYNDQKGFTIKSFGIAEYILCQPNPDYRIKWFASPHPQEFIFKKSKDLQKTANQYREQTTQEYVKFYTRTIDGLYNSKDNNNLHALLKAADDRLLASIGCCLPTGNHLIVQASNEEDITTEIIDFSSYLNTNIAKISHLSWDFARLINMDKADSIYYHHLLQLQAGKFQETFQKIKKEVNFLLSLKRIHTPNMYKIMLKDAKILSIGLTEERSIAEKVFKRLLTDITESANLELKYEYAKFMFEYKPMENSENIKDILKGFKPQEESIYISCKIYQLMRDVAYINGEKKEGDNINKKILALFNNENLSYLDDYAQLIYAEALATQGLYNKKMDDILQAYKIVKKTNSFYTKPYLSNILCSINSYFISQYSEVAPKEYIAELENLFRADYNSFTITEKIHIVSNLYDYHKSTLFQKPNIKNTSPQDLENSLKKELTYLIEYQAKMNPDINEYKCVEMRIAYIFKDYIRCEEIANELIKSDIFAHYHAFAYYYLGLMNVLNENYSIAKHQFKLASIMWEHLSKKYPTCKVYHDNYQSTNKFIILTRK